MAVESITGNAVTSSENDLSNGFLGGQLENLNKLKKIYNFFFLNPKMEGARVLALLLYF